MSKFGAKNALFGHFWVSILKNIVTCEISTLEFIYLPTFARKTKMPKFGTKNASFGHFWACII